MNTVDCTHSSAGITIGCSVNIRSSIISDFYVISKALLVMNFVRFWNRTQTYVHSQGWYAENYIAQWSEFLHQFVFHLIAIKMYSFDPEMYTGLCHLLASNYSSKNTFLYSYDTWFFDDEIRHNRCKFSSYHCQQLRSSTLVLKCNQNCIQARKNWAKQPQKSGRIFKWIPPDWSKIFIFNEHWIFIIYGRWRSKYNANGLIHTVYDSWFNKWIYHFHLPTFGNSLFAFRNSSKKNPVRLLCIQLIFQRYHTVQRWTNVLNFRSFWYRSLRFFSFGQHAHPEMRFQLSHWIRMLEIYSLAFVVRWPFWCCHHGSKND